MHCQAGFTSARSGWSTFCLEYVKFQRKNKDFFVLDEKYTFLCDIFYGASTRKKGNRKGALRAFYFLHLMRVCVGGCTSVHMVSTGCRLPVALRRIVDLSCNLMEVLN